MYAQSNIAGSYARSLGFDEGIFLNMEGRIAEGPGENIIIVKNKKLTTNDESESILPGITRTTALKLAEDMEYEVEIGPITIEALLTADEVFFTGTAAEITPICKITNGSDQDKNPGEWKIVEIGSGKPGPITRQISRKYAEMVRGKDAQYQNWLTYIYASEDEFAEAFNV
jgi:branched-chain amino acid aminotransferase